MEKWSGPISDEDDEKKDTHEKEEEEEAEEEGNEAVSPKAFGDVDVDEGVKAPLLGSPSKSANAQPGEMGNVVSSDDREVANRHIMRQQSQAVVAKKVSFDDSEKDKAIAKRKKMAGQLSDTEYRVTGSVAFDVYVSYLKSCGWFVCSILFMMMLGAQGIKIGN